VSHGVVAQVSESRGVTLRAVHSAAAPEVHRHKTELEGARQAYWQVSRVIQKKDRTEDDTDKP
jgi:hypothetical protein